MNESTHLINSARDGDLYAFGELVERYRAKVYALAFMHLRNHDDAFDAVQEAFIAVYRNLKKLKEIDRFDAWLTTIIKRECFRILRARKRQEELSKDSHTFASYQHSEDNLSDELSQAIKHLVEHDRKILELHYLAGYSHHEIAKKLKLNTGAIKTRIFRARQKLREELIPMAKKQTVKLTKKVMQELLLELAKSDDPYSAKALKQVAAANKKSEISKIAQDIAALVNEGEALERVLYMTDSVPFGAFSFLHLGKSFQSNDAAKLAANRIQSIILKQNSPISNDAFKLAANLMKSGLLKKNSPVSADELAPFFAYYGCLLHMGEGQEALVKAKIKFPKLVDIIQAILSNWIKTLEVAMNDPNFDPKKTKLMADVLAERKDIFTQAFADAIRFGEINGMLDTVCLFLAGLLWNPEYLDTKEIAGDWSKKLQESRKFLGRSRAAKSKR